MNKQLLFVIVIYNLDFHQSSTYQTLLLPHSDIPTYIIDNSLYSQIVQDSNVIFYSHHPDNPGVSFAYNEAAKYAKENGYEWMLLLDQDTHFPMQKVLYFNNLFYINDLYMYMCLSRDKLGTKIGVKNAKKNKYRH